MRTYILIILYLLFRGERKSRGFIFYIMTIISLCAILSVTPAHAQNNYKVKSIKTYLYYHEDGTFDAREVFSGRLSLSNTIIGEGDAIGPSSTTLVLVEIIGPAFTSRTGGTIELVAIAGGKTLYKQALKLRGFFTEKKSITIPFIVHDTGCEPLQLRATVIAANGKTHTKTTIVGFECGE